MTEGLPLSERRVETAADGTPVGLIRSAALLQRARDAAGPECAGVLDADSGRFML